jgi:hypothetical protein
MPRPAARRWIAWLLAVVLSPVTAPAAIPAADDPKAYSGHDWLRGLLDFNKRTLADAYRAVGAKDPKWDGPTLKFLDAMAYYFTYTSAGRPYREGVDVPTAEQCKALGQAAADAGCPDPLVMYCRGALMVNLGDRPAGGQMVGESVRGLVKRKYPPNRVLAAVRRVKELWPRDTQFELLERNAALSVADAVPNAPAGELRRAATVIEHLFTALPTDRKLAFCEELGRRGKADPWLVELFRGRYEVRAAWDARGSGFAHTVNDDGWKGFHDHLAKARDHLVKAHQLHPEFPEAATEMIPVAMGAGERLNTTPREWFDKAAAAQFDYAEAYDHYVYSLWPRWGGSFEQMYGYGIECLKTGRFDTVVPYRLWQIVLAINDDSTGDFAVLRVPELQVALWQLFTGMSDREPANAPVDPYRSLLAAIKWRTGDHAAAAGLMDKLGGRLDPSAFELVRGWPPAAASEVRAMTSPHAAALAAADGKAQAGDWDAAAAAYADVDAKVAPDHPGKFFVHERAAATRIQRDFAKGDWVKITPDESFAPWEVINGDWRRDKGGAIAATSGAGGAVLVCRADFGPAYELRARFVPTDPRAPSSPALLVGWTGGAYYSAAGVLTDKSTLHVRTSGANRDAPIDFKGGERITVRVNGPTFSVLVDDKPLIENQRLVHLLAGREPRVGLGINTLTAGRTARFADVEIRRLDAAPRPDAAE